MAKVDEEYRPRLTITITEEQARKLDKLIPWGMQSNIFRNAVQDVIDGIEKLGSLFLIAALDRKLRYGLHENDTAISHPDKSDKPIEAESKPDKDEPGG